MAGARLSGGDGMKLLTTFKEQLNTLGELRYVWLTSFNINIEFIETYLLPAVLDMEQPKTRLDYEHFQIALTEKAIDFRVFCDKRFMEADKNKRTAIPVHGVSPALWEEWFSKDSLFHPKVIYLEDKYGNKILGTGSANLTLSGWGRNQEVFSFYRVETKEQYDSVRHFFAEIAANVGLSEGLPERRGLPRDDGDWALVHSFQKKSFIEQIFADTRTRELLVWSPYLSKDVAAFIKRLKAVVAVDDIEINLVPDRVNGQFIRTPWTEALKELSDNGKLTFYDNPTYRHDNVELCHAKVWKLGTKLAIGSWNFTTRGANLLDEAGEWDKSVNIEAGVIVTDGNSWRCAVGKKIELSAAAFASDELLQDEALDVPAQLPFDIQVQFDWGKQRYEFAGHWHDDTPEEGYAIKVPGNDAAIPLVWMPHKKDLKVCVLKILDPTPLLHERRFQVMQGKKEVYRALVTETGLSYRRAQAFESLGDLLNAFVFGGEPGPGDDVPFRIPPSQNSESLENEFIDASQVAVSQTAGDISYFRLFQATHQYCEKLKAIKSVVELNSWVFTRPGCLVELVEKTRAKVNAGVPTLFNWFLAQEVQTLCRKAEEQRRALGKNDDSLPKSRWDELHLNLPPLPAGIERDYVEMIQKECGYAGV
jgi:hypothetical protein